MVVYVSNDVVLLVQSSLSDPPKRSKKSLLSDCNNPWKIWNESVSTCDGDTMEIDVVCVEDTVEIEVHNRPRMNDHRRVFQVSSGVSRRSLSADDPVEIEVTPADNTNVIDGHKQRRKQFREEEFCSLIY